MTRLEVVKCNIPIKYNFFKNREDFGKLVIFVGVGSG
jgi:hypothetical protein